MPEKIACVYKIANKVNGKIYVGSTKDAARRERTHWAELRRGAHCNPKLQHSFNKHGREAFEFVIIERCPIQDLVERETWWIQASQACVDGIGYNIAAFADAPNRGRAFSPEARANMSAAQKGRPKAPFTTAHIENMRAARRARAHVEVTDEVRDKLREARARRGPESEATKEKRRQHAYPKRGPHSEEAKAKMRAARLGKPSAMKGRKHTEEARSKMVAAKRSATRAPGVCPSPSTG